MVVTDTCRLEYVPGWAHTILMDVVRGTKESDWPSWISASPVIGSRTLFTFLPSMTVAVAHLPPVAFGVIFNIDTSKIFVMFIAAIKISLIGSRVKVMFLHER